MKAADYHKAAEELEKARAAIRCVYEKLQNNLDGFPGVAPFVDSLDNTDEELVYAIEWLNEIED